MPTYAWKCSECGFRTERFDRMTPTPPDEDCPSCGKRALARQIGSGAACYVEPDFTPKPLVTLPFKDGKPLVVRSKRELADAMAGRHCDGKERYRKA